MDKKEELIKIFNTVLQTDGCTLDTNKEDVESWDSLAHVMLISEIESKFQISIPFDDIDKIQQVKDFIKYIG